MRLDELEDVDATAAVVISMKPDHPGEWGVPADKVADTLEGLGSGEAVSDDAGSRRPVITKIMPDGATMKGLKSRREIRVGDQIEEDDGGIEVAYGGSPAELGYEWKLSGAPRADL